MSGGKCPGGLCPRTVNDTLHDQQVTSGNIISRPLVHSFLA